MTEACSRYQFADRTFSPEVFICCGNLTAASFQSQVGIKRILCMVDEELEELKQMFLEECLENVELLESGLMRMGDGESDSDTLNEVFRAAHSIKGGAASFGYQAMSELTHHMETLLDEMRSERRPVVSDDVDLLFEGLDIVQAILQQSQSGESGDHENRAELQTRLEAAVVVNADGVKDDASPNEESQVADAEPVSRDWVLHFTPELEFFLKGNNPLPLLKALARVGELKLSLKREKLPAWTDFDPNKCYLSWDGTLESSESKDEILQIFDWVQDECDLSIEVVERKTPDNSTDEESAESSATAKIVEAPLPATSATPPAASNAKGESGAEAPKKPTKKNSAPAEQATIRIATEKIDQLINMVGELVITQSMLSRVGEQVEPINVQELRERLADLEHHTRELQESVMQVRMLPIASAFSRLPRLVRDLSKKLDKDVDLVLEGGTTELDKTVLERMVDPLVHLVRNSLDHGLEGKAERLKANKPPLGKLVLSASQESGNVIIEIVDDGRGINGEVILKKAMDRGIVKPGEELSEDDINQLIFAPGFSTAETISDVSGRGVGMDVVRRNIVDLGGRVHVHSSFGSGTRVEIKLPLSLAILDGQLVRIANQVFVIPILSIVETMELGQTELSVLPEGNEVCLFRGVYLPTVNVAQQFELRAASKPRMVVIVETHKQRTGLLVDDIMGQQQVVIKPLESNYKAIQGLAGATIMSDGAVALILDPNGFKQPTQASKAA